MIKIESANPGYIVVTDEALTKWEVRLVRLNENGSVYHPPVSSISTLLNKITHGLWSAT